MTARTRLVRRALYEHRAIVWPIAIVLLINVLVYAVVVYPQEQEVNSVAERTRAAEVELAAARRLHEQATATLTGKDEAAQELRQFYRDVLPANLSRARELAFPRLDQMARQSDLRPLGIITTDPDRDAESTLWRVRIQATIAGTYGDIRRFIHQLEQAPEFLVIDRIVLAENTTEEGILTVDMELSTYYTDMAP